MMMFPMQSAAADVSLPNLIKRVQPSIVTVVGYDDTGESVQLGTGFFVDRRGHLVTNRHVLAGAVRAEVKGKSGRVYPIVEVLAEDPDGDLIKVLVDIPFTRVRPLRLSQKAPAPGEKVVVIGSPYGLEQTVSDGIVSTLREVDTIGSILQITAPISRGSSGSPVLDGRGQVIGIATVQVADAQNLNFAIPSARAIALKVERGRSFEEWAADTHMGAGLSAAASGEFEASRALYEQAIRLRPDSVESHDGLGMALHALGLYDEALESYENALRIDPSFVQSHFHVGELYERFEQPSKALESYEKVLRLRPDHASAHRNAALVAMRLGDRVDAMRRHAELRGIDRRLAEKLLLELEECCS